MKTILLADIGGTFIRLALYRSGKLSEISKLKCDDFKTPEVAVETYLKSKKTKPTDMIVAVAGSVEKGSVALTNRPWTLSEKKITKHFALDSCRLFNDFVVKGYSILDISPSEIIPIGNGRADKKAPMCVIGPGTGLGIAFLTQTERTWIVHPSEGGHVDIAPHTVTEQRILDYLSPKGIAVSAEEVLSGRGLVGIYQALHAVEGIQLPKAIIAEDLPWLAEKKDEMAIRAYHYFFDFLANFAGNMAITLKTTGGVYFISNLLKPDTVRKLLKKHAFRTSFENRGKMKDLAKSIPTYLIMREHSAFIGLKKLANMLIKPSQK